MYTLFIVILLSQCSGKKQPLRVYGGEDADIEAYPYVVRLETRYTGKLANGSMYFIVTHQCTASALSPTWALTAAHCITGLEKHLHKPYQFVRFVIRYGSVHSLPNVKNTFSRVILVIPHPLYIHLTGLKNDIGLIKTNPMPLKRFIKLSPVDFHTLYGHEAIFGGFGVTTKRNSVNKIITGDTLTLRKPLQIFKVLINKCKNVPGFGPSQCLGRRCGSIATVCGGDSGGPVIHSSGIVGVLSTGYDNKYCGDSTERTALDDSGSYCPVGPYVEWIANHVKN